MKNKFKTKLKKSLVYLLTVPLVGFSHNLKSSDNVSQKDSLESIVELGSPQVVDHFDYDKLSKRVREIIQNYSLPDTLKLDYELPFEDLYNHTKICSKYNLVNYDDMVGSMAKHLERFGYGYKISVISGDGEPVTKYIFRAVRGGKGYVFSLAEDYKKSIWEAKSYLELKERIKGEEKIIHEYKVKK